MYHIVKCKAAMPAVRLGSGFKLNSLNKSSEVFVTNNKSSKVR
jgi:hypothetical protein